MTCYDTSMPYKHKTKAYKLYAEKIAKEYLELLKEMTSRQAILKLAAQEETTDRTIYRYLQNNPDLNLQKNRYKNN